MRKFKTFFGIAMLCVILASCTIPPDIPIGWSEARIEFSPLRLYIDDGIIYTVQDHRGEWFGNLPLRNHTFSCFLYIFRRPAVMSHTHNSQIIVTTNFGDESLPLEYNCQSAAGVRSSQLKIGVFNDGNLDRFREQSLDIVIRSGPYRRFNGTGSIGSFIWNKRVIAGELSVNNVVRDEENVPLVMAGAFYPPLGRFVSIIPSPPNNNNNNNNNNNVLCVCGALHNRPSPPPGQSFPPCDCMVLQPVDRLPLLPPDFRFQYKLEDSRFTEVAQVEDTPDWFRTPNTVVMMPIQTNTNSGELRVYATAETYRQLVSR